MFKARACGIMMPCDSRECWLIFLKESILVFKEFLNSLPSDRNFDPAFMYSNLFVFACYLILCSLVVFASSRRWAGFTPPVSYISTLSAFSILFLCSFIS